MKILLICLSLFLVNIAAASDHSDIKNIRTLFDARDAAMMIRQQDLSQEEFFKFHDALYKVGIAISKLNSKMLRGQYQDLGPTKNPDIIEFKKLQDENTSQLGSLELNPSQKIRNDFIARNKAIRIAALKALYSVSSHLN